MLLLVLLCALAASAQDVPRVNITQGVIVGSRIVDGDYLSFYGIHYGAPPTGENRFKAPKEAPPYPGEFHAVNSDVICAQPSSRGLIGEENCLVVNIHTNSLTTPKPVIVWLEGEEYETTSKTFYLYKDLVQEGLVVVAMNYRLSIFGFLCLGVPEAPGNMGLKDVILGLKWIQSNIVAFGGDPNRVTLLGHGSGGAMVDLMTMSPLAKGLFHNVMVISGSALAPWAIAYDPIDHANNLGAKLEYTNKKPSALAKLLSTTDINVLSSVISDSVPYNNMPLFAPCIENAKLYPNETFISEAPIKLLRSGNYIDVPYVAGFTDREGTIRAKEAALDNWLPTMNENFEKFLTADLAFKTEENKLNASKTIREFYFGQRRINMETIEDFLDYMGDILILVPVTRGVVERALTSNSTVRLFEFAFRGTHNTGWAYPQIPLNGVKHGEILNYLFNLDLKENVGTARSALIKRVVHFAQTGSFQPPDAVSYDTVIDSHMNLSFLYIGGLEVKPNFTYTSQEIHLNPYKNRTDFWKKIHHEYYQLPKFINHQSDKPSSSNSLSIAVLLIIVPFLVSVL